MWIYGINTVATVLEKRPKAVKEVLLVKDTNTKLDELISKVAKQ